MTWTSAFDLGDCTVKVQQRYSGTEYYSGVLGKGASSGDFAGGFSDTLHVDVTEDGAVSLVRDAVSGSWNEYVLRVIPSAALGEQGLRMRSIAFGGGGGYTLSADAFADLASLDNDGEAVSLDQTDGVITPDPADLSTLPVRTEISLATLGGG